MKHSKIHNSRTNLINDKDVFVEEMDGDDNDYDRVDHASKFLHHHHTHHHHHDGRQSQALEVPVDDDSMRRHEMDRGSDIGYDQRASLKRQQAEDETNTARDQLFIKDGNAEILRLITRGKKADENIYVNVPPQQQQQAGKSNQQIPQYIMVDNGGKEILMRRYIEEQSNGKHVIREHYQVVPGPTYVESMPNEVQTHQQEVYVHKSQPTSQIGGMQFQEHLGHVDQETQMINANSQHSLIQQELENSLKQQNALLRQILLEKEKLEERYNQQETAMETQSLPCNSLAIATQTDCEASTQTETLESAKPSRRRARSENDESDSDDDFEYVRYSPPNSPNGVYWIKKRKSKSNRRGRSRDVKQKRVVMVEAVKRKIKTPIQEECEDPRSPLKTSEKTKSKKTSSKKPPSASLNKKILVEISDSLDENQIIPKIQSKKKYFSRTYLTAEPSPRLDRSKYEEEADSSGTEIVLKHYSADSLDEQSDVEEDKIKATKRTDPRNKVFSRQGSSTEARDALQQISDIIARSRPTSRMDKIQSAVESEDGRISRRDAAELPAKGRRQTASEPPQGRASKGPAPKPPDPAKPRRNINKDKTQSESDMLKKINEEGLEGASKSVPKYMEWYFSNKDKDKDPKEVKDGGKIEKGKSKVFAKKPAPGNDKMKSKKTSPMPNRMSDRDGEEKYKPEPLPRRTSPPKGPQMLKEVIQMAKNIEQKHLPIEEGSHSLLQHSEHRFEHDYTPAPTVPPPPNKLAHYMYPETPPHVNRETKINVKHLKATQSPIKEDEEKHSKSRPTNCPYQMDSSTKQLNASTLEDDHDSGIAMNSLLHSMGRRNPIVDKKSIFTIAYDDVKVNKIRSESESSPVT